MTAPADLATRLREARHAAGLSLSDLAERIGVSRQTIWRWEQGDQEPTGLPLRALLRWLASQARRARP